MPPLKRAKPYVYSDAEIDALLAAALAACKRTAAMDLPLYVRVDRGDHQRYFFVPSRKRPEKSGHFHRNR